MVRFHPAYITGLASRKGLQARQARWDGNERLPQAVLGRPDLPLRIDSGDRQAHQRPRLWGLGVRSSLETARAQPDHRGGSAQAQETPEAQRSFFGFTGAFI